MKTTFHRIYTSDGLELHGLLYEPDVTTTSILIHVHGMAGNFYENKFVDFIARALTDADIAFCSINNRGYEYIKDTYRIVDGAAPEFARIGTAFERFEDSVKDIDAFIQFVTEQGYSDIHLSGHSLGCAKVAYYMSETADARIHSISLLSPSDMLGLVRANSINFERDLTEAQDLVSTGKGAQLLTNWVWDEYPLSANTYFNLFADNAATGIFNFFDSNDTLESLNRITVPTYAVMGRKDDALTIDIETTFERLEKVLINSPKVKTEILGDANHGYRGHEAELATALTNWITSVTQ